MAITTYADIYNGKTQAEVETFILSLFPPGWPINDWNPGGTELTEIQLHSYAIADLYAFAGVVLSSGYLDTAAGDWLTLLAWAFFRERRNAALTTEGECLLTLAVGAGAQTITPGQLWLVADDGTRFSNTTGGTLDGGNPTLTVAVRAEFAGVAGNVPTGSIREILGTPLPGVTVSNPAIAFLNTWIRQFGSLVESDPELRKRCAAKWGAQGNGGPAAAYYYWARTAAPQVKKVKVFVNFFAGRPWAGGVTVYIGGDAGPLGAGIVAIVRDYIAARMPPMARLQVESAVALLIVVSGPLLLAQNAPDSKRVEVQKRIDGYATDVLDIGDTVYLSEIIGAAVAPPGGLVRDFKPTTPTADIQPNRNQIVGFDSSGITIRR